MTEDTATFVIAPGDQVWVPVNEDTECYRSVRVKEKQDDNVVVFDDNYKQWTTKLDQVYPVNPKNFDGVADNTQMMWLHDPSLLHNIRVRYNKNEIYTYTAYILISVNPYKSIPSLYEDDMIWKYYQSSIGSLPPHCFGIASRAYRMMKSSGKNQSIVVSGESGAGKTETCKFLMKFFAIVGGGQKEETPNLVNLRNIETKVLESNHIMESFGNAKTIRNNNSSRFSKFTELAFDKQGKLVGASIVTYLLEKSRVIQQAKNERNFHVFYQLIQGTDDSEKKKYKLLNFEGYEYLKYSGVYNITGVDDAKDFIQLKKSLTDIGVDNGEQENIFSTLSGILHLGNIQFVETVNSEKEDVTIVNPKSIDSLISAAELLGFDKDLLAERLVNRTIVVGNKNSFAMEDMKNKRASVRVEAKDKDTNIYKIPLTIQEAIYARDSLAKFIYGALFDNIVTKINKSLPFQQSSTFIGILDISGFEIFLNNSFEQFCINFANEKIQQYFNQQILKTEQEIYLLEGLQWRKIEYQDNQDIITLVENKRNGIFAILDEQCVVPKANDASFTSSVHMTHSGNNSIELPKYNKEFKGKRLNKEEAFIINHFAGQVLYNTSGFLDKNNDSLHDDLSRLLFISKKRFVVNLFPQDEEQQVTISRRFKSATNRFSQQLEALMTVLNNTTSHFIRCIKPNEMQQSDLFNNSSVMTQLRYNGMCTALKLMQFGFPTRCNFEDLYNTYAPFMPAELNKLNPRTFCEALLVALDLHGGKDFQMGLTKVFFRAGKLQFLDELTSSSQDTLTNIAGKVRQYLARKRWVQYAHAIICSRKLIEKMNRIRKFHEFRHMTRQHTVINKVWLPLLTKARNEIMTSEEHQLLLKQEEIRKEQAKEQERVRREEEEKIKKEKEEEQTKLQNQLKQEVELAKEREIQNKIRLKEKVKNAVQKVNILEETVATEQQKTRQYEVIIQQTKEQIERLEVTTKQLETENHTLEDKLQVNNTTKRTIEKQLSDTIQLLDQQKKVTVELQSELEAQKEVAETLTVALEQERSAHKKEINSILVTENTNKSELQLELDKALNEKSQLESKLRDEQLSSKQVASERELIKKQIEQLQVNYNKQVEDSKIAIQIEINKYDELEQQRQNEIQQKENIIQVEQAESKKLREELQTTQKQLMIEKDAVTNITRQKITIEEQLNEEKLRTDNLEKDLISQKEITNIGQKEIASLQSLNETLNQMLLKEREANAKLQEQLENEKKERSEDNKNSKDKMEKLFNQAKLDLKAKQVVIKKLEIANNEISGKLQEERKESQDKITDLDLQLKNITKNHSTLDEEFKSLTARYNALSEKHKLCEKEKVKLTKMVLQLQESKRKFKALIEKYPKQEDLAKLLFGELTFTQVVRDCTKHGLLQKQGGSHVNRWQPRHIIINENFLFYFGSASDKAPKGLARIDGDFLQEVSKIDLASLKKDNAFTVVVKEKDKTRPFFFSAGTPQEAEEWIKCIQQAQQSTTYI